MSKSKCVWLTVGNEGLASMVESKGIDVHSDSLLPGVFEKLPCEYVLIVNGSVKIPWDLLPAAWELLKKWDMAVPLSDYKLLAKDVGAKSDRNYTKDIIRDLRVPNYDTGLIFINKNAAGIKFMDEYIHQRTHGKNEQLAFLRAFYLTKPRLCALPTTWTIEAINTWGQSGATRYNRPKQSPLIRIEVAPGRFVKCHPGNEEAVREIYKKQQKRG